MDTTENNLTFNEGGESAVEAQNLRDILKETTGKDAPDDATALKMIQDTFKSVSESKKYENTIKQVAESKGIDPDAFLASLTEEKPTQVKSSTNDFVSRHELEEKLFYAENKELAPYKDILDTLRNKHGVSLEEAVKHDDFQNIYTKVKAYEERENTKSVLQSNPRLSKVGDSLEKAHDAINEFNTAMQQGNISTAERALDTAKKSAVSGVIDAFMQ